MWELHTFGVVHFFFSIQSAFLVFRHHYIKTERRDKKSYAIQSTFQQCHSLIVDNKKKNKNWALTSVRNVARWSRLGIVLIIKYRYKLFHIDIWLASTREAVHCPCLFSISWGVIKGRKLLLILHIKTKTKQKKQNKKKHKIKSSHS